MYGLQQRDPGSCLQTLAAGGYHSLSSGTLRPVAGSFAYMLLLSFPRTFPARTPIHRGGNATGLCSVLIQKRQKLGLVPSFCLVLNRVMEA